VENKEHKNNLQIIIHSWSTNSKCLQINSLSLHKGLMIWNSTIWKTGSHYSD